MADLIDKARTAVTDRAELPGMTLMEHLDELRKRIIHSVIYLLIGFCVAYAFHERLYGIVQAPLDQLHIQLNFTHPTDGLNLYLKTSMYGGAILASPFILFQLWLFISPGLYRHEQKYIVPFMATTVTLFLGGAWFGYHFVLPGMLRVLINDFGRKFHPIITIEDYTGFFLAIVLALGVTFELPVLMFFLALFGIVDGKFLLRHIRYAILLIFLVAAIICPSPDPIYMCLFALPMLVLYMVGVVAAFIVNPTKKKDAPKPA
ncbi:twin-arginine translocase subunit TatC [Granulicella aggregans]|jgi:sec-independent protein translocase protein TatC|uniref:twin-arginine translocase subunit TatC n=1 Tax=Granulicella aggregans TaxID=474949 RepID=UPI0021DF92CE|nr:twin-arginine translocase subunit TatC [Granulicella aggregans]